MFVQGAKDKGLLDLSVSALGLHLPSRLLIEVDQRGGIL